MFSDQFPDLFLYWPKGLCNLYVLPIEPKLKGIGAARGIVITYLCPVVVVGKNIIISFFEV